MSDCVTCGSNSMPTFTVCICDDCYRASNSLAIPENQGLHDEMKRLAEENFHLKRQLHRKNKTIKNLKSDIKKIKDRIPKKQHFKNGRRGTFKNGG